MPLLPQIALHMLPDLVQFTQAHVTGIFGSLSASMPGSDDSIVILATFTYEAGGLLS